MSDKLSGDEVTKRALSILQSSDFTKTLESFSNEKIKPTMQLMTKKINKAKKKLKKLQKRQRKQDKQGASNTADQWPHELVEKFLTEPREPYTPNTISDEWQKKQPISNGDRVEVKLGGCDEWFKGTVIRARKQEVKLEPHDYEYPKIADETNIIAIRIV